MGNGGALHYRHPGPPRDRRHALCARDRYFLPQRRTARHVLAAGGVLDTNVVAAPRYRPDPDDDRLCANDARARDAAQPRTHVDRWKYEFARHLAGGLDLLFAPCAVRSVVGAMA